MRIPESTLIIATFLTGILAANYLVPQALEPPAPAPCALVTAQEN